MTFNTAPMTRLTRLTSVIVLLLFSSFGRAEAMTLIDCPLRDTPFSLETPLMDILQNEQATAALRVTFPAIDQFPEHLVRTEPPSFSAITTSRGLAGLTRLPDPETALAKLERALAGVAVTEADRLARCARYDNEVPRFEMPDAPVSLLVFEKINGFHHGDSVDAATAAITRLGEELGWNVAVTDRGGAFNPETLAGFDAVIWNNVSGDVLTLSQRQAFKEYITDGGGFVGIHGSGGDAEYFWQWYADELLGARFIGHPMDPQFQQAQLSIERSPGGIESDLPSGWVMEDEWYSFAESPRLHGASIVATLDETTYTLKGHGGQDLRMGDDHPIAWTRCVGAGRAFYTAIGHRMEVYEVPENLALLGAGLRWAAGRGGEGCAAQPRKSSSAEPLLRQHGLKYSPLDQIRPDNVAELEVAWTYHTGDIPGGAGIVSFQDEPLLIADSLIVCSPSRRIAALDPQTGREKWVFEPGGMQGGGGKCRGVAAWEDRSLPATAPCQSRLFLASWDYRLLAIDSRTGKACDDFGEKGVVVMEASKPMKFPGEVSALSRPAVVNDVVVVGSSVMDNQRVDAPSGQVLAFDARSGVGLWAFDPVPRDPQDPAIATWGEGIPENGGANVWSGMVVDEALDLVFLPTTSPSVDFYGGDRPGDNRHANSVVALRGATGEVVWHQQIVHHDVWDYDLPTPGILVDYPHEGASVPALVQNTKQGLIFVFDRRTGEPLVPIEERPVPQVGAVEGEWLSPTQPFPVGMPAIAPQSFYPEQAWGFTPLDEWWCRNEAEKLSYGAIYTPPSERGTIYMPSPSGGPDWGGGAYHPERGIMVVGSNQVAMIIATKPRSEQPAVAAGKVNLMEGFTFDNTGAPYITKVKPFLSPLGAPCTPPPWAKLYAVDMHGKSILWEVPLGSIEEMAPLPIPWELGTPSVGAPLVTAGGLVFIGYTLDSKFRAMDLNSGSTLWSADLPAPATSVPVSYELDGEQYVVVAAGGHSMFGTELSDAVIAYRLP